MCNSISEAKGTMKQHNENLLAVFKLADKMKALALRGEYEREDTGCGVLYGALLDAAFTIKRKAKEENLMHDKEGPGDTPPALHAIIVCTTN